MRREHAKTQELISRGPEKRPGQRAPPVPWPCVFFYINLHFLSTASPGDVFFPRLHLVGSKKPPTLRASVKRRAVARFPRVLPLRRLTVRPGKKKTSGLRKKGVPGCALRQKKPAKPRFFLFQHPIQVTFTPGGCTQSTCNVYYPAYVSTQGVPTPSSGGGLCLSGSSKFWQFSLDLGQTGGVVTV